MARVNGIYNLPAGNPVVTGTTIAVSWANSTMPDIGAALTDSWCRDGGTPPYANMPMAGFKFTGLSSGTLAGDSATFGQLTSAALVAQTGTATTGNDSGAVNALALTLSPALTSYTPGMLFSINRIVATNTGASTIAVNGLAALPISSAFGALQGGELLINADALLRVNAAGTGVELVQTSGGFPVKAGAASGQAINLGQADGRYAALAGLSTQAFSAAAAVAAAEVVNLGQEDGRYAPISYTQFGAVINGDIALTAAQSGTTFEIASGVVTLPAVASGLRFRFIGKGGGTGVIAAPAGGINYPDGSSVTSANTVPITALTTWEIISDGTTWLITNTSGQVITKTATADNQAVNLGQFPSLSFGLNQSIVDVTASRAIGTRYINSTSKAKYVVISGYTAGTGSGMSLTVAGVVQSSQSVSISSGNLPFEACGIVLPGESYDITFSTTNWAIAKWTERG